ncbi:MAG TPA: methyltransferase, FxLD system [Pseudonocardia sp.]|nr:methyltransferase, FxLD system [Pseudonocardia sp.]
MQLNAAELRRHLVGQLVAHGYLHAGPVERAMRTVPRHVFLPKVPLEQAYANEVVITEPGGTGGLPLSTASQPSIVAVMLEQLAVEPGQRVLEIGTGPGYNAALLAELTGPAGSVTSLDIYPDVITSAEAALVEAGYADVRVVGRDGALGAAEHAPFDRIVVAVGPTDLPPAWHQQLAPGGRLVVPLRWRGLTRSIAFVRHGAGLRSVAGAMCGFIPMVGLDGERTAPLDPDNYASLCWEPDQAIDAAALRGVLDRRHTAAWSGVHVEPGESFEGVWLRFAAAEPGTCRVAVPSESNGAAGPRIRNPVAVDGATLAHFSWRHTEAGGHRGTELGAIGYGPDGAELAERLCGHIRDWGADRSAEPVFAAYPAGTAPAVLNGQVIRKRHIDLVMTF